MLRSMAVAIFLIIFLLISYPIFFVEWIVGKVRPKAKDVSSLRIVQWALNVILRISGVKITVIGRENIPDEAALFVGNHRSYFDILITYVQCRRLTGFVAKDSMEKIPSLRVWMRYLHCLFLDRDDIRQGMRVILQAIEQIRQGISIFIFPEGTRSSGDETNLLPFKEGSFKIALKSGCPIVPVSINNSADIFEKHMPWIRKTHVVLEYAKPVDPKSLSREEQKSIGSACRQIIEVNVRKNAAVGQGNP